MDHQFHATLEIIGVNPFVTVPEPILQALFTAAGRSAGPIPVSGMVNDNAFRQTLVRYKAQWRLYVNTTMLKNSPRRIGEELRLRIAYDGSDRRTPMPAPLATALDADTEARAVFESLRPSLQKEIMRYIGGLKSEQAVSRNVSRAIGFLHGRERFIGRNTITD